MKAFRDVIVDPPASTAEWDTTIRTDHHLHNYWPKQLKKMYRSHEAKSVKATKRHDDLINFPGFFLKQLSDQGITGQEATDRLNAEIAFWVYKRDKLKTIVKCCRVELEIRDALVTDGRDKVEPDDGKKAEDDIPVKSKEITTVDLSITRDPVGYNHL